jgi:hypothetical protein
MGGGSVFNFVYYVKKKRDLKYSFRIFYTIEAVVEGEINERGHKGDSKKY